MRYISYIIKEYHNQLLQLYKFWEKADEMGGKNAQDYSKWFMACNPTE